jgi:hypothetical protein
MIWAGIKLVTLRFSVVRSQQLSFKAKYDLNVIELERHTTPKPLRPGWDLNPRPPVISTV